MVSLASSLRLSAVVFFSVSTAAWAGPADDLSRAATAAFPGMQVTGGSIGEARDEGGNAVLQNITLSSTGAEPIGLKVGRVTVSGGIGSDGSLSNARVLVENAEGAGSDGNVFRFDRAEFTGVEGSLAAILANLAAQPPLIQSATLPASTGYSAQRISATGLSVTQTNQGLRQSLRYGAVTLTDYQRGRIGEITMAGLQMSPDGGSPAPTGTVGAIRVTGFDSTLPLQPGSASGVWANNVTIEGMQFTVPEQGSQPVTIGRITIGRMAVRSGQQSIMELTRAMQALAPNRGDEATQRRQAGLLAEFFDRIDMERIEIANLTGTNPGGGAFSLGRFAFVGISQGKIGSIEFDSLTAEAGLGQRVQIGRLAVEGIDASGLMVFAREFAAGRHDRRAPPPPTVFPEIRRILTDGLEVNDQRGRLLRVERFEIEAGPRIGLVPTRIRAQLTGFEAPIRDAAQRAQVAPLGLTDKVNLAANLEIEYVEAARELRLRTFKVEVDDVGALELALSIGGLERAQIEQLPTSAAVLGLSAKAGPVTLTYTEEGGVAALITHTAEQSGVSEDDFKEQLKQQLGPIIGQFVPNAPLAARIAEALGEFLDDPSSLVISATPKGDMPLAALAMAVRNSPLMLLNMVDVRIEANP
ncbi:hypothetical protein [Phreatobacter sp.]|uniref:hypothetical protein n=1 Tax=Phreatobacter sp. TaxID=1966341 RepID=UPI003F6FDE51